MLELVSSDFMGRTSPLLHILLLGHALVLRIVLAVDEAQCQWMYADTNTDGDRERNRIFIFQQGGIRGFQAESRGEARLRSGLYMAGN